MRTETHCVYFLVQSASHIPFNTSIKSLILSLTHDAGRPFAPRSTIRGVATSCLSIFNRRVQMILRIQSSFPSPLIMDHAHLSCILNEGTELEVGGARPHISLPPLLVAVISPRAAGSTTAPV